MGRNEGCAWLPPTPGQSRIPWVQQNIAGCSCYADGLFCHFRGQGVSRSPPIANMPIQQQLPEIDLNQLPLSCLDGQLKDASAQAAYSLGMTLVSMANSGRYDALVILFGLGYLYRDDLEKMKLFVASIRSLQHPEAVTFLKSELLRVPSSPSSRAYLRTVLNSLFSINSAQSIQALYDLMESPGLGKGYKRQIESFIFS